MQGVNIFGWKVMGVESYGQLLVKMHFVDSNGEGKQNIPMTYEKYHFIMNIIQRMRLITNNYITSRK